MRKYRWFVWSVVGLHLHVRNCHSAELGVWIKAAGHASHICACNESFSVCICNHYLHGTMSSSDKKPRNFGAWCYIKCGKWKFASTDRFPVGSDGELRSRGAFKLTSKSLPSDPSPRRPPFSDNPSRPALSRLSLHQKLDCSHQKHFRKSTSCVGWCPAVYD